ncbi:hypothetical protein I5H01_gp043 [Mycobacterium phage MarkPhew]|uniref:Uncharacterized protein n=1 Tax=Mycobacterium phage MarkPhew TaxID=2725625 RepID=A0A6M3TAH0_9CAUD|nr:hypothetical protein I5H01_gp043 [Mycobacterium phage MarkPhew]QJD50364.1 hypothetical protein SEA_MARKPHEW_64 [Mycobacterium phage MarkPhew]
MKPWRIRRLVEGEIVVGWVIEQYLGAELGHVVVDYYQDGPAAFAAFADPSTSGA